jgi:Holliday junction resolvase
MVNSVEKGKVGEREWANFCREHGFETVRRSQQYCGSADSADCIGLRAIHQEVKRVQSLSVDKAMEQATKDSEKSGNIPIVVHRKNHKKWLVTMYAEDWFKLYKEFIREE